MQCTFVLALLLLPPAVSRAEMRWQVDVMPASILVNFNDAFTLEQSGNTGTTKESISMMSSLPNITAGVSIETGGCNLELKAGPGLLLNTRVRAPMLFGTAGVSLEVKPSVFLGAHLQVMHCWDGDWWGDGKVDLKASNPTFGGGVHIIAGDKVAYLLSVDYMTITFDATGKEGWTANSDKLDMSGIAVQFGVKTSF